MNATTRQTRSLLFLVVLALGASTWGCTRMSESIEDETAGVNGGFEIVRDGLPVNWQVYSPATVPDADFDLILDTVDFHSGKQSLEFDVRECVCGGGWHSPGIANEYDIVEGSSYRVGFWAKSNGASFTAVVGGVTAFEGEFETMVESSGAISEWTHFEHEFTVPPGNPRLRIQISVKSPGKLWLDDVTIDPADAG